MKKIISSLFILFFSAQITFAAAETPRVRFWKPKFNMTLQLQFTGAPIDLSVRANVFDLDLFDTDEKTIEALHKKRKKVICYINAGAWENWRPDKDNFPSSVLGKDYTGWDGEKWLDIRKIDILAGIMKIRLDLCKKKGFDGVEADNINGYANDTGFLLTYQDQLRYNRWLAQEAHARGLAIGLKNDEEQVKDLAPHFEWMITEGCFVGRWCDQVLPFIEAKKPVWVIEYTDTDFSFEAFCHQAKKIRLKGILKNRELDSWRKTCNGI